MTAEQLAIAGGIIASIVTAGLAKKWVFGWVYSEMVADRNFWRDVALKSMGHVDKALGGKGE
jgi:hypothetical protein